MPLPRRQMTARGASDAASFIAYYRVSTDQQGRSGLGLEAQMATVGAYVAASHGTIVDTYQEVESGKLNSRPQLARALAACRARRAVLVIAKLDRLARDTEFLLSVVRGAEAGVVFCDLPQLPPGPAGAFILTMFAAVAELERGLISQRTKAALAAAKARGVKLGGPNMGRGFDTETCRAGRKARSEQKARHCADVMPYIADAQAAGAKSLRKIAAALTARGIQPPFGGDTWHSSQVHRILATTQRSPTGGARPAANHTTHFPKPRDSASGVTARAA